MLESCGGRERRQPKIGTKVSCVGAGKVGVGERRATQIWRRSGSVPAKFQPVMSVVMQSDAVEVLGLVAGGAVKLGGREGGVTKLAPATMAPVKSALVNVAEPRAGAGQVLSGEIPAREVVVRKSDAVHVLRLIAGGVGSCEDVREVELKLAPATVCR